MYSTSRIGSMRTALFPRSNVVFRYQRASLSVVAEEEVHINQRELRERAMMEALAREEEATARAKALRELKDKTKELVMLLNKTPSALMEERLRSLQNDLDKVADQEKVRQLDEELEEFMFASMHLPSSEVQNKPWYVPEATAQVDQSGPDDNTLRIQSTTSNSFTNVYPNLKPTPDYRPYSSQELYLRQLSHLNQSGNLGSTLSDVYVPRNEVKKPNTINDVTIASLLAAGCHLGHAKSMWRPSTQPYIYGEYNGIHLIDLQETISALKRATSVMKGVAKKGGIILYVGTLKHWEQHRALEEAAERSRGYYVSKRWIPGTITNFTEVSKQVGGGQRQEIDIADEPTNRQIGEQEAASVLKPDLVVILNPVENRNCINECIKLRIPTIGLCDTNMEPSLLTYPIPCNDDSTRASSYMIGILSTAAEEGREERIAFAQSQQPR